MSGGKGSVMAEDHGNHQDPRGTALSRRVLLRRAGAVTAGALAASLAMRLEPAAAAPAAGLTRATTDGVPAGAVPSLDELAGTWMPVGTLLNMPALNNFHGSLHAGTNLLSFSELTFPPLSLGGECLRLALNGINVQAHESRWYPYQVIRRATMGPIALQSTMRMAFEQQLVLIELQVTNTGDRTAAADLDVELGGYVRSYSQTWEWTIPRPYDDFSDWSGHLADSGRVLAVADGSSPAAAAFAFTAAPDRLNPAGTSGSAAWNMTLQPGQQRTIQFVVAADTNAEAATAAAADARARFNLLYAKAHASWERRFSDAFTPGNTHFSGSLPVLDTTDQRLRELYYLSVVSVLESERTNFADFFPRAYVTAGPQWGVTLTYFWDTSLFAPILVLLDPEMAREQAKHWLELGIYSGYAVDALSGKLVGPWYSANDSSVFTMLLDCVTLTGDMSFLDERAGSTSVIDHMEAIALNWQQLLVPATGLADYGGRSNLLEEVPNYVNQVPSLNAANVWMMREVAALRQARGESDAAARLSQQADQLAKRVLDLYVPGQGVWETVHDDGTRVPVRHVYDFDTIGRLLADDLTAAMRSEMTDFFTSELLAGGWIRALSLSDKDAAASLRPDHGSNGAYDSWPALAAGALGRFGEFGQMVRTLDDFAGVGAEGPFSQSHELVPQPSGLVVWDRDDLNPVDGLTVSAWINPAEWSAQAMDGSIVAKDAAAGAWFPTTPPNVGYALTGGAGGVISFAVAVGGKLRQVVTKATVPTGSWHHVVGTFDGHTLAVYIDGNPAANSAVSGAIRPSIGTNLMVGADPIDPARKFTGVVDEVRVYRRALSASEVATLYASDDPAYGGKDPGLVLRMPMDEGDGRSTADVVTGQTGTLINGDWVAGRYGKALAFAKSDELTVRVSRQQYNQPNGGSFASTILQDLFGYVPDGRKIVVRDPAAPRGIDASLHGIPWQGKLYTLSSTGSGLRLTQQPEALDG